MRNCSVNRGERMNGIEREKEKARKHLVLLIENKVTLEERNGEEFISLSQIQCNLWNKIFTNMDAILKL
jgi:hypothetical protein